jgi:hypothetical protein
MKSTHTGPLVRRHSVQICEDSLNELLAIRTLDHPLIPVRGSCVILRC